MEIFQRLNEERGITIVLITHEHEIAEYGTSIMSFRDGASSPIIRSPIAVLHRPNLAALPSVPNIA